MHGGVRDVDKATHSLHIDIVGPLPDSDDSYSYFLVGALRLPGLPLLIDFMLVAIRTSVEVCDKLEKMVAFLECLQAEGLLIGESCRLKRLHNDSAGEFTAPFFARFSQNHKTIYHTFTTGYDPQASGTAENWLLPSGTCVVVICCDVCSSILALPCPAEGPKVFALWSHCGDTSSGTQRGEVSISKIHDRSTSPLGPLG